MMDAMGERRKDRQERERERGREREMDDGRWKMVCSSKSHSSADELRLAISFNAAD
jgi:hypothetical protein